MSNIGVYDKNSFYDSNGVAFLTRFLQKEHSIKGIIASDDKIPNLDGSIQLLKRVYDTENAPVRIFHVQIKTLNCDYRNDNYSRNKSQYKYSVDTKVFNVVRENITSDPVVLFLVDERNEKVFWKYISMEYIMQIKLLDEKNKTIYFDETDRIIEIDTFHKQLSAIHTHLCEIQKNIEKNIITTNCEKETEMYTCLQAEWDYLDEILMNRFKIATEFFFPDVWKFGIAYEEGKYFNAIGIYMIRRGKNDVFIKDFSSKEKECFSICYYNKAEIEVHEVINKQIEAFAKRYFTIGRLPAKVMPDIMLEEIVFQFLDKVAEGYKEFEHSEYVNVYYKDKEEVQEIRRIWDNYAPLVLTEKRGLLPEQRCEIFKDVVQELEKRDISIVKRPWEPKKYRQMFEEYERIGLSGFNRKETGFLIEDIYTNARGILGELEKAYKAVIEKLWRERADRHIIKQEVSICFEEGNPSCKYYKIIRDNNDFKVILNEYKMNEIQILKNGKSNLTAYRAHNISSSDLYSCVCTETPLYDNIWHLINLEMWNGCAIRKPAMGSNYF